MILLDSGNFNAYSFIKEVLTSDVIDASFNTAMIKIQQLAIGLAVILYLLSLAYNYAKNSIASLQGRDGKFFDLSELIRTLVILVIIFNYGIIAKGLDSTMDIINTGTALSSTDFEQYRSKLKELNSNQPTKPEDLKNEATKNLKPENTDAANKVNAVKSDEGTQQDENKVSEEDTKKDVKFWEYLNPALWWQLSIDAMSMLLTGIIKVIISIFALVVFKVLLIFGSLAFAFSIIPAFRNQIDIWFGTVLTTGFVFTTMNILDHIIFNVLQDHLTNPAGVDYSSASIFNFVMIILYLSSFWLTSKYVGKGDAGRIMSKGVSMATGAVMLAAGAATMAAGGAGGGAGGGGAGGSGGSGNVASSAKDAFKDE